MNVKKPLGLLIILIFLLVLTGATHAEELRVSASVDRNQITADDLITFTIQIEGTSDFPDVPPPQSPDFVIVAGPSQSSSIQIINGRMNASKSISWRIAPTKSGKLVIPSVSITYRRSVYKTEPVIVDVSGQSASQPQTKQVPPAPQPKASQGEGVLLKAIPSKTTVYKGEELNVAFALYFKNVRTYAPKKLPDAKGFWIEEFLIKSEPDITTENLDGVTYKKAIIKRLALFPTTSGNLVVDPFVIDAEVIVPSQRRRSIFDDFLDDSFFDNSFGQTKVVSVSSSPLRVTVQDLPELGKPSNYSGAVGRFTISASIDTAVTTENQALTLKYQISGTGNISSLKMPELQLPNTLEVFEPKIGKSVNNQGDAISGTVTYEYVLIPRSSGRIRIPPVTFSYFDPNRGGYVSATARGFDIRVNPKGKTFASDRSSLNKEEVSLLGQDIRFIRRDNSGWNQISSSVFSEFWFWLLTVSSVVILIGAISFRWWIEKLETNISFARKRRAWPKSQKAFVLLDEKLKMGDLSGLASILNQILVGFISDRLNLSSAGISVAEIESQLSEKAIADETISRIARILSELEQLRFLPTAADAEKYSALVQEEKELITLLNKAI